MKLLKANIFILFCLSLAVLVTQPGVAQEEFAMGLTSFKNGQYTQSAEQFRQALQKDPHNAKILYNLAMAEFHSGQKGLAVGLLRKALNLNPYLAGAPETFEYFRKNMAHMNSEELQNHSGLFSYLPWLQQVPLIFYAALSTTLLFWFFWQLLKYLGQSKRRNELGEPSLSISFYCALILSCFVLVLTGFKFYYDRLSYGTILIEEVGLKATPQVEQVDMTKAYMGQLLRIREQQNDWVQVQDGSGNVGWIQASMIMPSQGRGI